MNSFTILFYNVILKDYVHALGAKPTTSHSKSLITIFTTPTSFWMKIKKRYHKARTAKLFSNKGRLGYQRIRNLNKKYCYFSNG